MLANYRFYDYADGFLRDFLGAESLSVLDYSDYEGADLVHDLNQPVPENLHGRFDAVIDGGALEHVFNFPMAISNLMKMTKVGGRVFLMLPANNLCGHGFYQFSPELMFRIFVGANGFALRRLILWEAKYPSIELTPGRVAYDVTDPEVVGDRVGLVSQGPVILIVEAEKIADIMPFATPPLQSDYVGHWKAAGPAAADGTLVRKFLKSVWRHLPFLLQSRLRGVLKKRSFSFSNRNFYKPLR